MSLTPARMAELTEKIDARERLTRTDGEDLYASDDLAWLGGLAPGLSTSRPALNYGADDMDGAPNLRPSGPRS